MIPLKTQVPAEQTAFSLGAVAEEGVAAVRYYPLSESQHLPPSFTVIHWSSLNLLKASPGP